MEITSFPKGINKIIIEYCHYPKLYLEEIKDEIFHLSISINYHSESVQDISYTHLVVIKLYFGWYLQLLMTGNRKHLISRRLERNKILGIKTGSETQSNYQRGYYHY